MTAGRTIPAAYMNRLVPRAFFGTFRRIQFASENA
jgi:hypothetical protein